MYAALWRLLPGPTWLKVIEALVLLGLVLWVLLAWVFPAVEPLLPVRPDHRRRLNGARWLRKDEVLSRNPESLWSNRDLVVTQSPVK